MGNKRGLAKFLDAGSGHLSGEVVGEGEEEGDGDRTLTMREILPRVPDPITMIRVTIPSATRAILRRTILLQTKLTTVHHVEHQGEPRQSIMQLHSRRSKMLSSIIAGKWRSPEGSSMQLPDSR